MKKCTIRDVDVRGKRVLVRVDFNVPLKAGQITDDTRIRAALPTIDQLRQRGARVVLLSHLGRPEGRVLDGLRLAPVARRLSELLRAPVAMAGDCVGPGAEAAVAGLRPGDVLMLENVRFHPEEERNDPRFACRLGALGDVFVNDAFGAAHRAHASTEGLAHVLPAVAGLLMEEELATMGAALDAPERPFVAVIGGAKVSDKIGVLRHLLSRVDSLLVGGGMANTFLRAQGHDVGRSLVELDQIDIARQVLDHARQRAHDLALPTDVVVAPEIKECAPTRAVAVEQVPGDWMIVDIGPETARSFAALVRGASTVIWNGPLGVFEISSFAEGTRAVARAIADSGATSIVGGGDSVAALEQLGVADRITHISTGGGATLKFLEGTPLPGVEALRDRPDGR